MIFHGLLKIIMKSIRKHEFHYINEMPNVSGNCIYCLHFTWKALNGVSYRIVIYGAYWLVICIFALIVVVPFLRNDLIRKVTYDEKTVLKMYKIYQAEWSDSLKRFKYQVPNLQQKKLKCAKKVYF